MKKTPKIIPLGDRVLIEPVSADKAGSMTKGGIIIPETVDKDRPEQGTVIAVGEGKVDSNGKLVSPKVKKGQVVIFAKFGPDQIKIDDQEYLIVKESDILAVLE